MKIFVSVISTLTQYVTGDMCRCVAVILTVDNTSVKLNAMLEVVVPVPVLENGCVPVASQVRGKYLSEIAIFTTSSPYMLFNIECEKNL